MCACEGLQNFVKNAECAVALSSRCMNIILLNIFIMYIYIFKVLCSLRISLIWIYLSLFKIFLLTVDFFKICPVGTSPSYVGIIEVGMYTWVVKSYQSFFFSKMGLASLSSARFFEILFSIYLTRSFKFRFSYSRILRNLINSCLILNGMRWENDVNVGGGRKGGVHYD